MPISPLTHVSTTASENLEPVVIELPSNQLDPLRRVPGTIAETTGKCLIILSPEEIASSSSIRVQGKDLLFLCDVVRSTAVEPGKWSIHTRVKNKFMIF